MLYLKITPSQYIDSKTNKVSMTNAIDLVLEHSLVSISKWESFYEKPFLDDSRKTEDEIYYYIYCMSLTEVTPEDIRRLTTDDIVEVTEYISKKHSATWFSETDNTKSLNSGSVVTSEIVYYWMITLNVPSEFERWNLNRLLTLIRVINAKNQPPKKMSQQEAMIRARELNRQRRESLGTKG